MGLLRWRIVDRERELVCWRERMTRKRLSVKIRDGGDEEEAGQLVGVTREGAGD